MSAIFDTQSLQVQAKMARLEAQRQQEADFVRAFQETYRFVNVEDVSSVERQAGRRMVRSVFEAKLQALNPGISFYTWYPNEEHAAFMHLPEGVGVRDVYRNTPEGREKVSRFRAEPILNEYSIVLLQDRPIARIGEDGFLERTLTDLPKVRRNKLPDGTYDVEFEGESNLQDTIKEPCGEIRGWRSVLLQLIQARVLDLQEVEREFGAGDRLTWAVKLGRRTDLGLSPV